MNVEEKNSKFFDECCDFFGNKSWAAACYLDENSQRGGFHSISKYLPLKNSSLLDIGCGQGDYLSFIQEIDKGVSRYKGIDVSQRMVDFACEKFSNKFFSKQYFLSEQKYDFDLAVAIGTFNIRSFEKDEDQIKYLKENIKKMYDSSKKACALTLLSYHGYEEVKKENRLFCYEPWDIFKYCINLTSSVIIDHASITAEFIVVLYH